MGVLSKEEIDKNDLRKEDIQIFRKREKGDGEGERIPPTWLQWFGRFQIQLFHGLVHDVLPFLEGVQSIQLGSWLSP